MRFQAVFYMLARLLFVMAGFLLVPAAVAYSFQEINVVKIFVMTAFCTGGIGLVLFFLCREAKNEGIAVRDGFLLVTLAWILVSLVGAFPLYLSNYFPNFIDALFESVSGFTTTGASVLSNIEALPKGVLFWRNFSQWIGGMGIVVFAIAILPQLSVGGMQLMKNEMPGPTFEQLKPRIRQTALSLWKIYVLFSLLEVAALYLCGMPFFESVCHMFATMSTGGFSPMNKSIAAYDSTAIYLVISVFMFLAGTNFVLHYSFLRGDFKKILVDTEWKFYFGLMVISILVIALDLVFQYHYDWGKSFIQSVFQVLSIATTTGFATDDFGKWPHFSMGLLFLLMFVGGCAGSTSGGMKQIRLLLLFKKAKQSIVQHIFPKAVISTKVNGRAIPESVLHGISSFFLIYIVIFSFTTLALLAFNLDFVTATSAVVASLSNIGPGFGRVGASQNYAFLPDFVKLLLATCMIIGRLEIFTVLVLFFPGTWRR